jgi:hypothetical protein
MLFGIMTNIFLDAQDGAITSISSDQMLNPGENITLTCSVVKPDEINVSWLKDNTMFTLGSYLVFQNPRIKITVDDKTFSLHVRINDSFVP